MKYMEADEYTLYVHDETAGWAQLPDTKVPNKVVDIGKHKLQKGGRLQGFWKKGKNTTIEAIAGNGLIIEEDTPKRSFRW